MHTSNSVSALYDYWKKQDYEKVYEISTNILDKNPLNNSANTFKGYSAFMLAISESEDMSLAQNYLDESINHLRVSLLNSKKSSTPQIEYALGRTYFIKNKTSSYHYYADLAIKYFALFAAAGTILICGGRMPIPSGSTAGATTQPSPKTR